LVREIELRELEGRISLMFQGSTRGDRSPCEAKRMRFPLSSTKTHRALAGNS
jgi:hypothetical protein